MATLTELVVNGAVVAKLRLFEFAIPPHTTLAPLPVRSPLQLPAAPGVALPVPLLPGSEVVSVRTIRPFASNASLSVLGPPSSGLRRPVAPRRLEAGGGRCGGGGR